MILLGTPGSYSHRNASILLAVELATLGALGLHQEYLKHA